MKALKMALVALFVLGVAACSKGQDQNGQEKAAAPAQQAAPAAHEQKSDGGYNPDADADSDC